ncbi:MAG: TlpA disulfide reductase family protein [Pseudomonadota bacterium]
MKLFKYTVLYMALAFSANAASADMYEISDLREGDMRKLVVHSEPKAAPETAFMLEDGGEGQIGEYTDQITVLNFWATWCAPCRHEMPMLSQLQKELGGDEFEVVTIATGRNPPPAMKKFFEEIEVENLPLHADPRMGLSREMGIFGLPVTIILDREGQEIARLQGDADWSSDEALTLLKALIERTEPS